MQTKAIRGDGTELWKLELDFRAATFSLCRFTRRFATAQTKTGDVGQFVNLRRIVCRVGQATAPAHHLSDVVGLRSAGPTLRVPQFHKLANCGVNRVMPAPQQET